MYPVISFSFHFQWIECFFTCSSRLFFFFHFLCYYVSSYITIVFWIFCPSCLSFHFLYFFHPQWINCFVTCSSKRLFPHLFFAYGSILFSSCFLLCSKYPVNSVHYYHTNCIFSSQQISFVVIQSCSLFPLAPVTTSRIYYCIL